MPKPKREFTSKEAKSYQGALFSFMREQKLNPEHTITGRLFRSIDAEAEVVTDKPGLPGNKQEVDAEAEKAALYNDILNGDAYFYSIDSREPMKLSFEKTDNPDKPFSLEATPVDLTPPKKPNFFKQIFHSLFGAFQKDFDNYEKAVRTVDHLKTAAAQRRNEEIGSGEKKQYDEIVAEKAHREIINSMERSAKWIDGCMKRLDETMGPTFQLDPELVKEEVCETDFTLPSYQKPEQFSVRESALIALSAFADPNVGGMYINGGSHTPEVNIHGNYAFVVEGFFAAFRKGIGERGYTHGLEQSHTLAAEAMEKYVNGDPKELARYISLGLKENNLNIIPKESISEKSACYAKINSELLDVLKKHPDLKETALKENYLTQKDLARAEISRGAVELYQGYRESKLKLESSLRGGAQLSTDEKASCLAKITSYLQINQEFSHNYATDTSTKEAEEKASKRISELMDAENAAAMAEGRMPDTKKPEIAEAYLFLDVCIMQKQPSENMLRLGKPGAVQELQNSLKNFNCIRALSEKPVEQLTNMLNSESAFLTSVNNGILEEKKAQQGNLDGPDVPTVEEAVLDDADKVMEEEDAPQMDAPNVLS